MGPSATENSTDAIAAEASDPTGSVTVISSEPTIEMFGSNLQFNPAGGGRYDVLGDITIQTGSSTYVATVDANSRLRLVADSGDSDVMRAELLLSFAVSEWGPAEMRISGVVSEAGTSSSLVGFFRSSISENSALIDQGSVTGELLIGSQGSMALKLAP